jgi:hypothetical protein
VGYILPIKTEARSDVGFDTDARSGIARLLILCRVEIERILEGIGCRVFGPGLECDSSRGDNPCLESYSCLGPEFDLYRRSCMLTLALHRMQMPLDPEPTLIPGRFLFSCSFILHLRFVLSRNTMVYMGFRCSV